MIRVYAIDNYTSQLANSVVYSDADMGVIVNELNRYGSKYNLYDNCYKMGILRIYIESNNSIWDPVNKKYEDYSIGRFLTDARKRLLKLRIIKKKGRD